ncbi:MAG: HAMP domain-containing protein [Leptospiraceae bacterium]|nr:HAMP domain-containing protein [Leptospiraceae bacterium]
MKSKLYFNTYIHSAMYMGTSFLANFLVVLSMQLFLGDLIFLPESREHFKNIVYTNTVYTAIINWLPFPVTFGAFIIYLRPLRYLYKSNVTESSKEKAIVRLLNAPIIMGLLTITGWVMGVSSQYIIYGIEGQQIELTEILNNIGSSSALSIMTFVISYYAADLINRKIYIPHFLPHGIPATLKGVLQISLRFRLEIFILSAAIAPILILTLTCINFLLQAGEGTSQYVIYALGSTFILTAIGIALMLARFLQKPLEEMQRAVHEIQKLNFNIQLPVTSSDEIGSLAMGINEMAAGLAEKETIKDTFGRAVDPRIRDHMLSGKIDLEGESLTATVLFCDIRDFTSFSEKNNPAQVVEWLNTYFEAMANVIEKYGGVINKYIGDAIMAVFNAPLPVQDHALCSVLCAREMLHKLNELNATQSDVNKHIKIGIGISTGAVLAGNIGSKSRVEYTVIGDTVNTASRVESLCKKLNHPLLFTRAVYDEIQQSSNGPSLPISRAGKVQVKGKAIELEIFTLEGI